MTITPLLSSYSTVAHAAIKTVRDINGNRVEIDTDNLTHAEEDTDEEISYGDLIKRNASSKPWVKNGKKYLPFTDRYLSSTQYDKFIRKVQTQKIIKDKKAGKMYTKNLRLSAKLNNDKLIIKITNAGKKKLTEVRLYCFQDDGMMRIFADSSENQIAYTELRTADYAEVLSAEVETTSIGLEDISAKYLTSTNGERIYGDDKITAGETVTVTANVSLATSLPAVLMPLPEKAEGN